VSTTDNNGNDTARLQTPSHQKHIVEDPDMSRAPKETGSVTILAIVFIGIMAAAKLAIGILINSVALLSEGLHTLIDLFAAYISYITVRAASAPPDLEHRYGHGKIENAAGIAQAAFIFVPTIIIVYRAIIGIINLDSVLSAGGLDIGTLVMLFTIFVNIFLALRLMAVAKKYKSEAIRAAAYHQLNDLWTSIGVFVALALIWWKPEWKILDPLVALIVTGISMWMAWSLFSVSFQNLLDKSAGPEIDKAVLEAIGRQKPTVRGYHNLRTRRAGSTTYVDLHVEVCGELSFRKAHDIIENIERDIALVLDRPDVIIHADPCVEDCEKCDLDPKPGRPL